MANKSHYSVERVKELLAKMAKANSSLSASDRAHRIGQQRPVTIYRLVAENTIEEKIIQLHATKRDLADTLLEGSDMSAKISLNELVELIKNV
ncbi:hypothetical protein AGMMS50239_06070 [Bacteroidia bacterium]|nr:hypothetical protein AGMMS50239_06070 [Bacteroidia bacterium]